MVSRKYGIVSTFGYNVTAAILILPYLAYRFWYAPTDNTNETTRADLSLLLLLLLVNYGGRSSMNQFRTSLMSFKDGTTILPKLFLNMAEGLIDPTEVGPVKSFHFSYGRLFDTIVRCVPRLLFTTETLKPPQQRCDPSAPVLSTARPSTFLVLRAITYRRRCHRKSQLLERHS